MPQPATCKHCGSGLHQDRFNGLCPSCLWRGLTGPDDDDAPEGPEAQAAAAPFADLFPGPDVGNTPRAASLLAIPGLEVIEEISRGGMGIVYRARQVRPGRFVALKMLLPHLAGSPAMRDRFRTECRAVARLDHPAILPIHDVGEHEGIPYFTMKLAGGGTLASRRGALLGRFRDIAATVATLARAMQFAHERGILHRDLKPGNILFDESHRPYVADFGLAKLFDLESAAEGVDGDNPRGVATQSQTTLGTPHYLAPEIAAGGARHATTASDIYGLGTILFELLAGRPPFAADSLHALLRQIAESEAPSPDAVRTAAVPAAVPRDLGVICLKCLAKDPARRYPSALTLAEDLDRWLEGRPILARPATVTDRLLAWARRNPVPAALAALLAAALLTGAVLQYRAYRQLGAALAQATSAQGEARENLRVSLIAQAQAQRQTRQPGQRRLALESATRSARIAPSLEARREAAAALAVLDLQDPPQNLPLYFANADSTAEFTHGLDRYVVGHPKGGFMLRRTADGTLLGTFASGRSQPAHDFRLSPDGRTVFATWLDGSAALWPLPDPADPGPHAETAAEPIREFPARRSGPPRIAFHPDTNVLSYLLIDPDGTARWHASATDTGTPLAPPAPPLLGASFAPSGELVALVHTDGTLEVREWPMGRTRATLSESFSTPEPAWHPNGRHVAIGSRREQQIAVVDITTGEAVVTLRAAGLKPTRIAFHPDGQRVAAVGLDRMLRLWDAGSGHELLQRGAAPRALRFSADGLRLGFAPEHLALAVADLDAPTVWRSWPAAIGPRDRADTLAIHARGTLLASADTRQVKVWDVTTRRPILAWNAPGPAASSLFFTTEPETLVLGSGSGSIDQRRLRRGPQGQWLADPPQNSPLPNPGWLTSLGPADRLWMLERRVRQEIAFWPDGDPARERRITIGERFNGAALSPDGQILATLNAPTPGVTLRRADTGEILHRLDTRGHATAGFSPDGRWLVTGTSAEYRFWDPATGQPGPAWPARLTGRGTGRFFFSPSGRFLAMVQDREALLVIDPRSQREMITLIPPVALELVDAVWGPDDARLYLLDGANRVYEWSLAELDQALRPLGLGW